jgi:hypothetical protein
MQHYLGVARDMGISEEEIGAVQAVVMAVSAGKVNAQLREVQSRTTARFDVAACPVPPLREGTPSPPSRADKRPIEEG